MINRAIQNQAARAVERFNNAYPIGTAIEAAKLIDERRPYDWQLTKEAA